MSIASDTAPAPTTTPVAATSHTDKAGAYRTEPPLKVVSDIPGVPTTTAAPAPSVNGLAFRSGASPAPSTTTNTKTAAQPGIVKWKVQPASTPIRTPNSSKKVPIVDAPDTGTPASVPAPTSGFPSPGRESIHKLPKFIDDRTRITFGIQQAIPEAVRRAVRDNWEKCLIGSEFHQAFVVRSHPFHSLQGIAAKSNSPR